MAFQKKEVLCNYDVRPKVFTAGKPAEIHIKNLGDRSRFKPGEEYTLTVCALCGGKPCDYPATGDFQEKKLRCNAMGGFDFSHTFYKEQEYFLRIDSFENGQRSFRLQLEVYCVEDGLIGRYPFMGDLHMHTSCSDGQQTPEVVAANYRRHGYDFLAITDHNRYYPSLRAMAFYKNVPTEFVLVPGEEVHMPPVDGLRADAHIVNFGGEYSVNAMVEGIQTQEVGTKKRCRSLYGSCPEVMTQEEYEEKIREEMKKLKVPDNVDAHTAAILGFVSSNIRQGGGLCIFAHPTWISDVYHVPDAVNDYLVENHLFDAFEVLGGENYFEQNGFQTVRYYEDKARGFRYPVVGSTDSHNSYYYNRNAFVCSTIVFSPENERRELISSIKDFYSVAVDTISPEYRIVGEMRLVRYARFLLDNYFPLHDELCFEEGRLMKQYAVGDEQERDEAFKTLSLINGRVQKLRGIYFDF